MTSCLTFDSRLSQIFISYFDAAPNAHIFSRFGFVPASSNKHDRLMLPAELAPLSGEAVRATTRSAGGKWDEERPLLEAALLSLPLTREASEGGEAEAAAAAAIEEWLQQTAAREFATSLEEDEATLAALIAEASSSVGGGASQDEPVGASSGGDDVTRRMCLLGYRIQRKRLWRMALDVVVVHQQTHGAAEACDS